MQELEYPQDNPQAYDLGRRLDEARERIAKLEELVNELLIVYYDQDSGTISRLCEELGI